MTLFNLSGRVALVTGASRGLGRAISVALAEAGADVVLTDILVEDAFDSREMSGYSPLAAFFSQTDGVYTKSTAEDIRLSGRRSMALRMDVTSPDEIRDVIARVKDELGPVDILVNNAVIMDNFGLIEKQRPDLWERDLKVNLTGAFNCIQAVWPDMKERQWGRIVNISSFVAIMGAFAQPSYGASKAGLLGLTRSMALEGARSGITANAILPGFIQTEAVKLHDPGKLERITARCPMQRLGHPEEVASLAVFLASDAAAYITGAAIPVTGGMDLFHF